MKEIVIKIDEKLYNHIKNDDVYYLEDDKDLYMAVMNGTPLESYLPNERCDTCKYVDCSIDNEPCIDCKVPHKSFYEPRQEMNGGGEDEDSD